MINMLTKSRCHVFPVGCVAFSIFWLFTATLAHAAVRNCRLHSLYKWPAVHSWKLCTLFALYPTTDQPTSVTDANMLTQTESPVFILGGGPVGLSLALFLNHWAVDCVILNAGEEARSFPKGNGENCRTMEHFRQIGISDEVRQLFPQNHNFDQAYFTRFNSWEIFRVPNPCWQERKKQRASRPVDDQYPEPMFHTNQMYLESYLLEKVKEAKHVSVWFGWEAISFQQDDNEVVVTAKKVKEPHEQHSWKAKYLADCGGGHSLVRKGLGIHYKGDVQSADQAHWAGDFWNVWVRIKDFYPKLVGHRKAWFYWAVNDDPNTRSCLIALNGEDEFMLMVKPKGGQGVTAEETKKWIRASMGEDLEVEVVDFAPWRAGVALAVEKYVTGRIFQLGDAAHLFTPVGSFGMVSASSHLGEHVLHR